MIGSARWRGYIYRNEKRQHHPVDRIDPHDPLVEKQAHPLGPPKVLPVDQHHDEA